MILFNYPKDKNDQLLEKPIDYETFYNTVRIHSHCNYESPNEHEKKYWKELRKLEIETV